LLSQAENKGKSLWAGAQAEADRLSGHVKGDAAELKEVSRVALRFAFPSFYLATRKRSLTLLLSPFIHS
jgi:hypothetical protein